MGKIRVRAGSGSAGGEITQAEAPRRGRSDTDGLGGEERLGRDCSCFPAGQNPVVSTCGSGVPKRAGRKCFSHILHNRISSPQGVG